MSNKHEDKIDTHNSECDTLTDVTMRDYWFREGLLMYAPEGEYKLKEKKEVRERDSDLNYLGAVNMATIWDEFDEDRTEDEKARAGHARLSGMDRPELRTPEQQFSFLCSLASGLNDMGYKGASEGCTVLAEFLASEAGQARELEKSRSENNSFIASELRRICLKYFQLRFNEYRLRTYTDEQTLLGFLDGFPESRDTAERSYPGGREWPDEVADDVKQFTKDYSWYGETPDGKQEALYFNFTYQPNNVTEPPRKVEHKVTWKTIFRKRDKGYPPAEGMEWEKTARVKDDQHGEEDDYKPVKCGP